MFRVGTSCLSRSSRRCPSMYRSLSFSSSATHEGDDASKHTTNNNTTNKKTKKSSTTSSTTSRDTRIAGRLRFYKDVGVTSVSPPWILLEGDKGKPSKATTTTTTTIENPISAGVDGTDSASGVHRPKTTNGATDIHLEYMLTPRSPGGSSSSTNSPKWFGVTLDGRILKTPMGKTLAVPSETLAYAIAAEWNGQDKYLKPTDMPLMTLACTALDQAADHAHVYREQALRFLPTDTTCFWADPTEDRVLHRRQEQAWKELHQFVKDTLDHSPACSMGAQEAMLMSRKRGDAKPQTGLPHPPELIDKAADWTQSLDAWHLVSLASICAQAKSFLVAWAMLTPGSPLQDLNKAAEASRVEEEFQISNWGLVEGGHDYDRLNCSIQLHSAQLFVKTIALDNEL